MFVELHMYFCDITLCGYNYALFFFQVYFDQIQAWMCGLQQLPEMSKRLKNFLEEEWNFTKLVCPLVRGGEANAGNRFWLCSTIL